MIDATQLPRVPTKLAAAKGSGVADAPEKGVVSVGQADLSTASAAQVQAYPAKDLALVAGRYRAVGRQK